MIDSPDTWPEIAARLGAAAALGAVVGWDRERKGRAAGLRTHMLVALGAAAFIVGAMEIIEEMAHATKVEFDPMRVVQGIAGGVGFLGAGAIIHSGGKVQGLTTAAGLWVCAAIGLAAGSGVYRTALLTAAFCLVILTMVHWIEPNHRRNGDEEPAGEGGEDQPSRKRISRSAKGD